MSQCNFSIDFCPIDPSKGEIQWIFKLEETKYKLPPEEVAPAHQSDLSLLSARLAVWIEQLEKIYYQDYPNGPRKFLDIFSDASVKSQISSPKDKNTGEQKSEIDFLKSSEKKWDSNYALEACASFYWAVHIFLNSEDRYSNWNARIIYLFSAWQAYNLVKALCRSTDTNKKYLYLLADCYNRLIRIFEDSQFREAVYWLAYWYGDTRSDNPMTRQLLRRSVVLGFHDDKESEIRKTGGEVINPRKPIPAPKVFDKKDQTWNKVNLHPVFSTQPGNRAVRQLIIQWLLPLYDFDSSIHLAFLLKNNKKIFPSWLNHLRLFNFLLFMFVIILGNIAFYLINKYTSWNYEFLSLGIALAEFIIFGLSYWFVLQNYFDTAVLPYLALPRLLGGIVVGYLLFISQNDSLKIVNAFSFTLDPSKTQFTGNVFSMITSVKGWFSLFWGGLPLILLFWAGILLVGFLYLYYDARPWSGDKKVSRERAWYALSIAIISSAFIGLVTCSITNAAYGYSQPYWGSFLGPFGWVDIKQWLVFTPLALVTGLVSQFLLEDRTLTASVWAPDQF